MFRKSAKAFSKRIYIPLSLFAESFEVASCLPSCHFPVRLLCAFPGLVFSSAAGAKSLSWFVQNFSFAMSAPFLSLYLSFLYYLSLCPYFFVLRVFPWANYIWEYALLPALHLPLPFPLAKATWMSLLVTSLTGSRLFCVTAAAVQGAARRKKEGKPVLSSWQVFCWLASLCHNLRATTFPSDLTSESALDAFS